MFSSKKLTVFKFDFYQFNVVFNIHKSFDFPDLKVKNKKNN